MVKIDEYVRGILTEPMCRLQLALEELSERVNGDMRMALNQLQYMSLRQQTLKYTDVRTRLMASAKDEDITPFSAVDKSVPLACQSFIVFDDVLHCFCYDMYMYLAIPIHVVRFIQCKMKITNQDFAFISIITFNYS